MTFPHHIPAPRSERRLPAHRATLATLLACAALAGGLQLAARPPAASADTLQLVNGGQALTLNTGPLAPDWTPLNPIPFPRPVFYPSVSVSNINNQIVQRVYQGQLVYVLATDFQGPVQITLGGVSMGTVLGGGPPKALYIPWSIPGSQYVNLIAGQGSIQATDRLWLDYAPQ